jgi:hypothetical protein
MSTGVGIEPTLCAGSGETCEVFDSQLVKRGITYTFRGGTVLCTSCNTYVRLHDPHAAGYDKCPPHLPGEARPRRRH